ncbi:MAG: hypothetical protein ABIA21_02340, partial [Candidatus Aenigmatarchaeota archaeon]
MTRTFLSREVMSRYDIVLPDLSVYCEPHDREANRGTRDNYLKALGNIDNFYEFCLRYPNIRATIGVVDEWYNAGNRARDSHLEGKRNDVGDLLKTRLVDLDIYDIDNIERLGEILEKPGELSDVDYELIMVGASCAINQGPTAIMTNDRGILRFGMFLSKYLSNDCPAMILDIFTELDSTGNVFRQGDKNDMGLLLCHSALRKKYYPTSVFS